MGSTAAPHLGILGLGRMGAPIARRLGEVFEVSAFDPAHTAGSAAEVAARSQVLVTVLPGAAEARSDLPEVLRALPRGALWLDLTSGDPRVTRELADVAAASGVRSAAAPMAGGPEDAEAGTLRFFVGADPTDREEVGRVLAPLGTTSEAGTPEQAQLIKLLVNGLWFGQVVAVTEALLLAQHAGLEPETVRRLLAGSAAGSVFLDRHAPLLLAGDPLASFGLARVVEELEGLQAVAEEAAAPHHILSVVAELHRRALAEYGPVDGELLAARYLGFVHRPDTSGA